jgi:hypothetical protein
MSGKNEKSTGPATAPLSQPADVTKREDMGPIDNSVDVEGTGTTSANPVAAAAGLQSQNAEIHLGLVDAPGSDGKTAKVEVDDNGRAKGNVYERYLAKARDVTPLYRLIVREGAPLTEVTREAIKKAEKAAAQS